ncbi:hypothetical protein PRIPAC_89468, partial [Pristionchus pacificus]|uniref:Uncharacterized protein n=1 Tax=Pristionchus pacificus TaxID=54126 RepID=A0A2A6B6W5_PRIPA
GLLFVSLGDGVTRAGDGVRAAAAAAADCLLRAAAPGERGSGRVTLLTRLLLRGRRLVGHVALGRHATRRLRLHSNRSTLRIRPGQQYLYLDAALVEATARLLVCRRDGQTLQHTVFDSSRRQTARARTRETQRTRGAERERITVPEGGRALARIERMREHYRNPVLKQYGDLLSYRSFSTLALSGIGPASAPFLTGSRSLVSRWVSDWPAVSGATIPNSDSKSHLKYRNHSIIGIHSIIYRTPSSTKAPPPSLVHSTSHGSHRTPTLPYLEYLIIELLLREAVLLHSQCPQPLALRQGGRVETGELVLIGHQLGHLKGSDLKIVESAY